MPALQLVILLGKYSYSTLPGLGPTCGASSLLPYYKGRFQAEDVERKLFVRPSDPLADELLLKLLNLAKGTVDWNEQFNLEEEVCHLKTQIEYLAGFGIEGYFPKSYALMSSWL